jgi:phosphatidylinositol alpha-1,6-mannosyltransferase
MPSTGEGFGIAFLEAMASGTPALGLDIGGARDALADGELGTCLTETGLTAALARALGTPKRDREALAGAVRARFGCRSFTAGACAAVPRVLASS